MVRIRCMPLVHNIIWKVDVFLSFLWIYCPYIIYTFYIHYDSAKQNIYDIQRRTWRPLVPSIKQRDIHAPPHLGCSSNTAEPPSPSPSRCQRGCVLWLAATKDTRSLIECGVSLFFKQTKDGDRTVCHRKFNWSPIVGLRTDMSSYDQKTYVFRECRNRRPYKKKLQALRCWHKHRLNTKNR